MESTVVSCFFNLLFFSIHIHLISASSIPGFPEEALPTRSGYLPVNPATGSAIFYAFYEAQQPTLPLPETPLVIWLQGGPGCSSMIGNFYELGPWRVFTPPHGQNVEHLALEPNPAPWNRLFGLVFLDNPIGTGFSIASTAAEIPRDQTTVAKHLFAAISSFVESNPSFKSRPIYITGESYAGKYVPAIGYYILKKNPQLPESERVNLAGVAIGNGLTDPITQVATHADNAYFSGLVNAKQKAQMEKLQIAAVKLINEGNWTEATNARNRVLRFLKNATGLATLYDFTRQKEYQDDLVTELLKPSDVKKALGVNESIKFELCSDVVGEALHADVMKSVKHMVEYLVSESKVLLYQGHFDLRDGVVSTEAWMKKMKWDGIDRFLESERRVWRVAGELAGFVQRSESLSHVVVLGAGHLVPTDQPLRSQVMIEDWIMGKGMFGEDRNDTDGDQNLVLDVVSVDSSCHLCL